MASLNSNLSAMREPHQASDAVESLAIPRNVLALAGVAHPEKTRYAMNGIMLERVGRECRAVATDGKRLAIVEWTDTTEGGGGDVARVLPCDLATKAAKAAKAAKVGEVEASLNGRAELKIRDDSVSGDVVEGHFPPYRDVLKGEREEIVVGINASLLEGLAKALHEAKDTGAKRGNYVVRLRISKGNPAEAPIIVETCSGNGSFTGIGLLMPVDIG